MSLSRTRRPLNVKTLVLPRLTHESFSNSHAGIAASSAASVSLALGYGLRIALRDFFRPD